MSDIQPFGLLILLGAVVGLAAVLSNRISEHARVPAPAIFLAGAAVAAHFVASIHELPHQSAERLVTLALIIILFDGGMHIGWPRLRTSVGPVVVVGFLGTFLTTAAVALVAHLALDLSWWVSLLIGTAVAPTDPAVVFSVLGKRQIAGRSGTILEGESGANDPVGIALMVGLLSAGGVSAGALTEVGAEFLLQMVVGGLVGLLGGRALLWFMRRVALPSEALYPLRTLAAAMLIYGVATFAQGSGFLAVFLAGILIGDARAPYKREVERFHSALASLGEIVAFVVLGLSVDFAVLARSDVWLPGLLLAVMLSFVIRPLLVGLCLLPFGLERNERLFVLWGGLKGAVPLLLGSFILTVEVPERERLYGIVVVVVGFSVLVQGTSIPAVARLLRIPMRVVEPEPWALGLRLRDEPDSVHRFTIAADAPADGQSIRDLTDLTEDVWVSFVIRGGQLVAVQGDTELQAGDEVLVLAPQDLRERLTTVFATPGTAQSGGDQP